MLNPDLPLRIVVDGLRVKPGDYRPPPCYDFAYHEFGRDAYIYMPAGVAQLVGWWVRHRYDMHRLLCRLGLLDLQWPVAPYYRDMRWRWDFWNGSRSWWALLLAPEDEG